MWSNVPRTQMMSVSLTESRMATSSGFSLSNLSRTSCLLTCVCVHTCAVVVVRFNCGGEFLQCLTNMRPIIYGDSM